jgi:serine/threonine-protein kinase HipA
MRKLSVRFQGWGEDWVLGTLAELDRSIYLEYSEEALARGLEFSPYKVKLAPGVRKDFPNYFDHMPGFIADALPDGWGRLLMDRAFERAGRDRTTISPLERLAFIGDGAMGALAFEPASDYRLERSDLSLLQIARAAKKVLEGRDTDVSLVHACGLRCPALRPGRGQARADTFRGRGLACGLQASAGRIPAAAAGDLVRDG